MKVAIIGGGAVGLLVAAYLYKGNIKTRIYSRRAEQAFLLNEHGLEIIKNGLKEKYEVKADPFSKGLNNDEDLIIITVKQYDLPPIIKYLTENKINTPVLFLQNGMSHISMLSNLYSDSIYVGVVEHGVLKYSGACISHTGEGCIKLALYSGSTAPINEILNSLNNVGFKMVLEDEWYPILVKKLVVNAVINPLTALYGVRNGRLLENKFYFHNMKLLFDEIIKVVHLSDMEGLWEDVVSICQNTGGNYSSMYKDIELRRQTEIHAILGYLLEEGEKRGLPMPLSRFLYYSIKGMENIREEEGNG